MKASGNGFWEMDLADGSAWFSDWFYTRLRWVDSAKRPAFHDLKPYVAPDTWEQLLRQLRAHLEQRTPLELQFQVSLPDGATQRWQLHGMAQRNEAGHPTHFAGTVRDVGAGSQQGS